MTTDPAPDAYLLRRVREDDAAAVLEAFRSAADMERQGEVTDLDSAHHYVAWLRDPSRVAYAVTCDDVMVGLVGVTLDQANRSGWVFYWIHADHRGRGVMARAVTAVCDLLLADGLERLELGHRVNNPSSGAVARAAGFVLEGRERGKFLFEGERVDVLNYGRLAGDPGSDRPPLRIDEVRASTPRREQMRAGALRAMADFGDRAAVRRAMEDWDDVAAG